MKAVRLKKTLATCSILAILLSLSIFSVPSYALTEGDWTYEVTDGKATITAYARTSGAVAIPSTLGGYPVTALGDNLFKDKTNITGITIPEGITSIGQYAFSACGGLTSITLPNSVTNIGQSAFRWCLNLTSVNIPEGVTSLEYQTFYACQRLPSITFPSTLLSIGDYAFYDCDAFTSITLPNSVTAIGKASFGTCSGLTSITLSNSLISIGEKAFTDCWYLENVTIPNQVTSIGPNAFANCYRFTSVVIPDSVTSLGEDAFYRCSRVTTVDLGRGITNIGAKVFEFAEGISSIICRGDAPSINSSAFPENVKTNAIIFYDPSTLGWPVGKYTYVSNGWSYKIYPMLAPNTPTNLSAVGGINKVDLSWSATAGTQSYTLMYSTASDLSSPITANFTTNSASITGLPSSTTYYFAIRSNNVIGSSAYSATVSATTLTTYKVLYNLNGGTGSVPTSVEYEAGATVPVLFTPVPTKTGYVFLGWDSNSGATSATYTTTGTTSFNMGTADKNLYAIWREANFTFTIKPPLRVEDYTAPSGTTYHLIRGLEPNGESVYAVMSTYFSITDGSWKLYKLVPSTGTYTQVGQTDTVTKVGSGFKIEVYDLSNALTNTYYIAILGDVTCDGLINVQDTSALKNHINGISPITNDIVYYCGDAVANTPKLINVQDALAVKKHITGIALITQ